MANSLLVYICICHIDITMSNFGGKTQHLKRPGKRMLYIYIYNMWTVTQIPDYYY